MLLGRNRTTSSIMEEKKHVGMSGVHAGLYSKEMKSTKLVNPIIERNVETTGSPTKENSAPMKLRTSMAIAALVNIE